MAIRSCKSCGAAQCLSGTIALALLTFVCFRLGLNLATSACLYLAVIVLLSLRASFLSSAFASLVAVGFLAYYFAAPIFSLRVGDPFNLVAIGVFLTVSSVISHLVSKLRIRADELASTNAALKAQITERNQVEEALRDARAQLERIARVTFLGQLTASIAHEINQPLTGAVTNANACLRWLARDAPDLDEARAAAGRIVKDGTRAAEIISRIRLLFKKGASKRELVDINDVIREMLSLLRSEAARYSITVRTRLAADLPRVMGDRVQLQQVMMNFIINSIEAMKEVDGARELAIQSQQAESEDVLVSVSDTGVGLPRQQDQIFHAFFTTKLHGTGMGLSISRSIAESHGGRLWAAANAPRGASFYLTLPTELEAER